MTRGDFHALLEQVDGRYAGRPEALERSMDRWVRLGTAVLAAWLATLLGLAAALFALGVVLPPPAGLVPLGLGVVLGLYAIAQAGLLIPVDPGKPDGRVLGRSEAPELTALLDDLRRDLGCRAFDEVRIGGDFNASVSEHGRGRLGRTRTVLEIGLPLLLVLSPAEFRAVLAHEFVHLSARHGRGGARVARLHRRWAELFDRLHKPGAGTFRRAFRGAAMKFVGWYWPRLQARSLALSRHHEHHADRVAASVAGAEPLVSALWQLQCRNPWLVERFWPDERLGAMSAPEPPPDVMHRLRDALLVPPDPIDAARWGERALGRRTLRDETHPAFGDRARALGLPAEAVEALRFTADRPDTAAAILLGPALDEVARDQSDRWRTAERAAWRDRHRRAKLEARRRRPSLADDVKTTETARGERPLPFAGSVLTPAGAEPAGVAAVGTQKPPDVVRLWVEARDVAELRGIDHAAPQLAAILDLVPNHPGASVLYGQHLLGRAAAEGERLLWAVAAAGDEQWTPHACQLLENHYRLSGQTELQQRARDHLDRHEADVERARDERAHIEPGNPFAAHDLPPETLGPLVALLGGTAGCVGGWLARKVVRYFPDRPLFVLAVRSAPQLWGMADRDGDAALVRALAVQVQLPGQVLVVSRSGGFRGVARAVERVPGAQIFPAPGSGPAPTT